MNQATILFSLWATLSVGVLCAQEQPKGKPDSPADSVAARATVARPVAKPDVNSGINFVPNPGRVTSLDSLLKAHKGRVVYVDFWGTWCVPCRKEMPYSARLREKFKGQPVDFLYVAFENGYSAKVIAKWKATVAQLNIKGRHFIMNPEFEGALTEYLEVDSYPRYVIIDRYGEILYPHAARPSQTNTAVRQLEEALEHE